MAGKKGLLPIIEQTEEAHRWLLTSARVGRENGLHHISRRREEREAKSSSFSSSGSADDKLWLTRVKAQSHNQLSDLKSWYQDTEGSNLLSQHSSRCKRTNNRGLPWGVVAIAAKPPQQLCCLCSGESHPPVAAMHPSLLTKAPVWLLRKSLRLRTSLLFSRVWFQPDTSPDSADCQHKAEMDHGEAN